MNKVKFGLITASGTLVAGLGSAVLFNGIAHGEWDLPGLQQQVQHVTEVSQNHEARINNLEGKVNTPTISPTPMPQAVPDVSTAPAPSATSSAAPVVVSTTQQQTTAASTPAPRTVTSWYSDTYMCNESQTTTYYSHWSDGKNQTTNYRLAEDTDSTYKPDTSQSASCSNNTLTP